MKIDLEVEYRKQKRRESFTALVYGALLLSWIAWGCQILFGSSG